MFSAELAEDNDRRHLMRYSETGRFGRDTSQVHRDRLRYNNIVGKIHYYANQTTNPIHDLNQLIEQAEGIRTQCYKDRALEAINRYVPSDLLNAFADYDQELREAREEAGEVGTFKDVERDFWLMVRSVKQLVGRANMERGYFLSFGLHNLPFAHHILHELKGRMETFKNEAKAAVRQGKRPAEKKYDYYKQNPPGGADSSNRQYYGIQ
jgi:hypothetical protein